MNPLVEKRLVCKWSETQIWKADLMKTDQNGCHLVFPFEIQNIQFGLWIVETTLEAILIYTFQKINSKDEWTFKIEQLFGVF